MNYPAKIDKEIVRDLPIACTNCEIEVIDQPEQVDEAVEVLSQCPILGFDTETRPSFKKGVINKIALLQLSTDKKCFLFRLQMIGKSESLKELLENESIKKIGLAIDGDFNKLNAWQRIKPRSVIDLQKIVPKHGIEELGLQKIYAILFGKRISKSKQLSNWEAKILDRGQQVYAATDAWACRQIYLKLEGEN